MASEPWEESGDYFVPLEVTSVATYLNIVIGITSIFYSIRIW